MGRYFQNFIFLLRKKPLIFVLIYFKVQWPLQSKIIPLIQCHFSGMKLDFMKILTKLNFQMEVSNINLTYDDF